MLGVPDRVMAKVLPHFGHNYNYVSRELMYQWFNKQLGLGLSEPVLEEDFKPLTVAELTVWDESHPKPAGDGDYERSLVRTMTADAQQQIAALQPRDSASLAHFREVIGGGVDVLVGRRLPPAEDLEADPLGEEDQGDYTQILSLWRNKAQDEEIPVVILHPKQWQKRVVIFAHDSGKDGLFDADGKPNAEVKKLLASGAAVVAPDLIYQGEFLADGKGLSSGRRVDNPREFAGYTFGYNSALFAQRAHDLLTTISMCRGYGDTRPRVELLAFGDCAAWAAAALAQADGAVARAALDTGGFRFAKLRSLGDLNFLPGGAKYGDLPGMLALAAPTELWLAGEGDTMPDWVRAAYGACGAANKLKATSAEAGTQAAAIEWLSRP